MISPTFTHISKNIRSKVRASLCYLQNSFREDHLLKSNGIQTRWAAAAKSLQSCPTLCDPMNCSPPGSSILGFSRQEFWSGVPLLSPLAPNSLKEDSFCGTDMRTFLNMAAPPVKFCTSHVPAAKRRRTCLDLVRLT